MKNITWEIVQDFETSKTYFRMIETLQRDTSEWIEISKEEFIFELDNQKDLTRLIRYFWYQSMEFEDDKYSDTWNLYVLTWWGRKNEGDNKILSEYEKQTM